MRLSFYIALMLLSASCASHRPLVENRLVRDSVRVDSQTQLRDTLLKVPLARVRAALPLSDLKAAKPFKGLMRKDKNLRLVVRRIRDTLRIITQCDSLSLAAQIRDRIIRETRQKQVVQTRFVRQPYVPGWVKLLAWAGGLGLLFTGVKIARIL